MQRKLPQQQLKRLRDDKNQFADLRSQIARWALDHMEALRHAKLPTTVRVLKDRARDNWRCLFTIAEQIGGEWPKRARQAARNLERYAPEENYNIMLLEDIHRYLQQHKKAKAFRSEDLIAWLVTLEDRPWAEYGRSEKQITPHRVAKLLEAFEIVPKDKPKVYLHGRWVRGYDRKWFAGAFERYVTPKLGSPSKAE